MWKFNYIRADLEEVAMGGYATKGIAVIERNRIASFGALCSEPFEVPGEAPIRVGRYVDIKVAKFDSYFRKEMATLSEKGITYQIFYDFLYTAIRRIKLVIREAVPAVLEEEKFGKEKVQEFAAYRAEYLLRVAYIIIREANYYSSSDGSAWESLSERLVKLAEEVVNDKIDLAQLFVVVVLHNVGHGASSTDVIQVSQDPFEAMLAARDAENLGYEFYSEGSGVAIYRLEMSRKYTKDELKFPDSGQLPPDYPVIFYRRKIENSEWEEAWPDKELANLLCRLTS